MVTTITISGNGATSYGGAQGIVDVFDFNTNGPTTLTVVNSLLRQSAAGVLDLELRGSPNPETVLIQLVPTDGGTKGGVMDARNVAFGGGWSDAQDGVIIRDTGFGDVIKGTSLGDRIEATGGRDSYDGSGGSDTLVLQWGAKTEDFTTLSATVIDGTGPTRMAFQRFEKMDATFGSGDDSVSGLAGWDKLRGGAGEDSLSGLGGDDRLWGGDDDDRLSGGAGNDYLRGGSGDDRMSGGEGNDTYVVGSLGDRVFESGGGGTDTVLSSVDFTLSGALERLELTGSADLSGFGSDLGNRITGNEGRNGIAGLGGRDDIRLGGDSERDTVMFFQVSESDGTSRDVVRGFDAANEDRIGLQVPVVEGVEFPGLEFQTRTGGSLDSDSFTADIAAALNGRLNGGGFVDAILWNPTGGDLDDPDRRFLVVDLNNDGSYNAAADLVVEFTGLQGTLDASDFRLMAVL